MFHPSGGLASYTTATASSIRRRTTPGTGPDHIGSRKTSDDDVLGLTYGYDAVGHVTSIQDHRGGTTSATFDYDDLDRLTTANGAWGSLAWEYDVIGNRLLQTKNGVDTHYDYTTTNHLDHTSGGQAESFTYDAAGLLHGRTAAAATGTRRTACRSKPRSPARRPGTGTTRTASASGRSLAAR